MCKLLDDVTVSLQDEVRWLIYSIILCKTLSPPLFFQAPGRTSHPFPQTNNYLLNMVAVSGSSDRYEHCSTKIEQGPPLLQTGARTINQQGSCSFQSGSS